MRVFIPVVILFATVKAIIPARHVFPRQDSSLPDDCSPDNSLQCCGAGFFQCTDVGNVFTFCPEGTSSELGLVAGNENWRWWRDADPETTNTFSYTLTNTC
jgi:hypothetical protein